MATHVAHPTSTTPMETTSSKDGTMSKRPRADNFSINPEFLKLLMATKAEHLHPSSGVVYICKREDKIVDVWKGLIKYNFWSCPVLQKTKDKYYGFVDLMDILDTVIGIFGRNKLENTEDFWNANAMDEVFQKKTVSEVMTYPLSRKNPFHPVTKGYSLFSAIELLAREHGLHRIPVIDENRKLVNIITQTQVIQFLNKNINKMGPIKDRPITMMPSARSTVVKVSENETTLEAFKLMHYKNITGVAVVNDEGKLVGAISHSDLKLIQSDARMFWRLYQTVKNFLLKNRKEGYERPTHPIVADSHETIETALRKFEENHVHRIFVVDDHKKPVGIISLKDILMEIISVESMI